VDIPEVLSSQILIFLQGLFESILCPEEHPLYFDSLISQLDKLMMCDYPTPESHGNLMSDQFQNLWVMSVLREELELVQNLLLYVDSCELQLKSFIKLFKIILVRHLLDLKCSNNTAVEVWLMHALHSWQMCVQCGEDIPDE
jgi:hypothetical protein